MKMARTSCFFLLCLSLAGCQLITDFDRSRIVDAPDTDVTDDAGTDAGDTGDDVMDAGDDVMDAGGDVGDAGMDAMDALDAMDAPDATDAMDADTGDAMCTPQNCDDSLVCTVDSCMDNMCMNVPDDGLCNDGNPCTVETCDANSGCMAVDSCDLGVEMVLPLARRLTVSTLAVGDGDLLAVVFDDNGGNPDMVLGEAFLPSGAGPLDIDLNRSVVDGETLHVQLFEDDGSTIYDAGVDSPATDAAAAPIAVQFTASVPAGTPDFEVMFAGDGSDFTFSQAGPPPFSASGPDPALELIRGARYRFTNTTTEHPFQFLGMAIYAAQNTDPTTETSDTDMNWVENGGVFTFTVSSGFEAGVDMYRSSRHPAAANGSVTYID